MMSMIDNLQGAIDVSDVNIKHIYNKNSIVVMLSDQFIDVCDLSEFDTENGNVKTSRIERSSINDFCLNELSTVLYLSDRKSIYQVNLSFDDGGQGYKKLFTEVEQAVEEIPNQAYKLFTVGNLIIAHTFYNFVVLKEMQVIGNFKPPPGVAMKITEIQNSLFILLESGQILIYDLKTMSCKPSGQINVNYIDFGFQGQLQRTLMQSQGNTIIIITQQALFLYRLDESGLKQVFESPNQFFTSGIIIDEISQTQQMNLETQNLEDYFLLHCIQLNDQQMVQSETFQYIALTNITLESIQGKNQNYFNIDQIKSTYGPIYLDTEYPKIDLCQFGLNGNVLTIIMYGNQSILLITQLYMIKDEEQVKNEEYVYPLVFNDLIQLNFGSDVEIQEAQSLNKNNIKVGQTLQPTQNKINQNMNDCFIDKDSNEIIQIQQIYLQKNHYLNLRQDKIVNKLKAQFEKKKNEKKNDKPTMFRPQDYIKSNIISQLKLCDFLTKKHNQATKNFNQYENTVQISKQYSRSRLFAQKLKNKQLKLVQSLSTDQQIIQTINVGKQLFISQTSQNSLQLYSTVKETITVKKEQRISQPPNKKQTTGQNAGKKQLLHFKSNFCFQQQVQTYAIDSSAQFLVVSVNQGYQLYDVATKAGILQQVKHTNAKYHEKVLKNHQPTYISFINNNFKYRSVNQLKQRYTERLLLSNLLNDLYLDYFCYDAEDAYKQVQISTISQWSFTESIWSGASFTNTFSPHTFLCIGSSIQGFDLLRGKIAFQYDIQGTYGVAAKGIQLSLPDFQCCDQKFFAAYGQIGDRHASGNSYEKQILIFDIRVKNPVRTFLFSQNIKSVAFKNPVEFYALGKNVLYLSNIQHSSTQEISVFEKADLFNTVQHFQNPESDVSGVILSGKDVRVYI